jgi:hypothetical protein
MVISLGADAYVSGNDPFYTTDHTEQCFGNVTKQVGCDGASDVVACLRKASSA